MSPKPDFDRQAAHKFFSTHCFNKAWDLIDKVKRTPEEDQDMIRLSLASHYHWTQRDDFSNINAAIGFWQTSRIYAILRQAENATQYGKLSLDACQGGDVPPFFVAYAYEALARAEAAAGNRENMENMLNKAKTVAEKITKSEDKKQLLDDLKTIQIS